MMSDILIVTAIIATPLAFILLVHWGFSLPGGVYDRDNEAGW